MKNKIENINNEFFGEDARKRYIKDDFIRVLRGAIIRGAIIDILIEASKNRTHIRKSSDGITYGDFDPDNAGYLYDLFSFYEKGFVIDVRQLLTVQEDGAAGKFVKLAKNISINDLYAYYDNKKVPPLLFNAYFQAQKVDKSTTYSDFMTNNCKVLENELNLFVKKCQQFESKGYYDKIVRHYQKLELHKDQEPDKYDVFVKNITIGYLTKQTMTRKNKSSVDIKSVSEFLNDLACIISSYRLLDGKNTSFINTSFRLDPGIENVFSIFKQDVQKKIINKNIDDVRKYFKDSVRLAGWDLK